MTERDAAPSAGGGATPHEMPSWDCLDLLGGHHFGRICVVDGGYPLAFPITYRLMRRDAAVEIVIRTASHTAMARHDGHASLEIDEVDEVHGRAWSVIARGTLQRVVGSHQLLEDPRPFVDEGRHTWLVLHVEAMSGRRFARTEQDTGYAVEWQVTQG